MKMMAAAVETVQIKRAVSVAAMKTGAAVLKENAINRLRLPCAASLAAALLLCSSAQAAAPKTCDDVLWSPQMAPPANQQPLNSPGANKPKDVDSLFVKAEQAKLKSYLTCESNLLPSSTEAPAWAAKAQTSASAAANTKAFYAGLASALASGKNANGVSVSRSSLAQAAYLQKLSSAGNKMGGFNRPNAEWRLRQAQDWCNANDKSDDGSTALPNKLPSLDDGVATLDPYAIQLAMKVASGMTTQQLGFGCNSVLKEMGK